jgi:hypothetical protein
MLIDNTCLSLIRDHDEAYWQNVIFSDEKTFSSAAHGALHCWRPKGERFEERHLNITHNSGRITKAVWGWMSSFGVGELAVIENRLNGKPNKEPLCLKQH